VEVERVKKLHKVLFFALFLLIAVPGWAESLLNPGIEKWKDENTGQEVEVFSGQVVARFSPEAPPERIQEIAREYGFTILRTIPELNAFLFQVPEGKTIRQAMDFLKGKGETLYSEPHFLARLHLIPNDTYYSSYQWPLKPPSAPRYGRINGEQAWDIEKGNASVTVAVIDSGVDTTHPDLQANWASWGADNVDFIGQWTGSTCTGPDNNPYDSSNVGHGTAVSGIIAAVTNNNLGVAGTAWLVKILPLRVIGTCQGADPLGGIFFISQAMVYAGGRPDVKVINLSLGSTVSSQLMEDAAEYDYVNGKLVVASAGNDGINQVNYPAGYPHVMAVASVDEDGARSNFSNYGNWVDIAAPGGTNLEGTLGITTTDMQGNLGYASGDYYAGFGGTSASSPYVAGVAALVYSHFPNWTPDQVEAHLKATATKPPGWNNLWGAGIVNAYNAVSALNDTVPPVVTGAEAIASDRVNVYFSEEMDPVSASDKTNYSITGGSGLSVLTTFLSPDGKTVQLLTSPQVGGTTYTVTVSTNVKDNHGNPLPSAVGSRTANFVGTNQDTNIALQSNGGVATAWFTFSDTDLCVPTSTSPYANDGNMSTAWQQQVGSNPNFSTFLMVRFSSPHRIEKIVVRTDPNYLLEYHIEAGWALCGIITNIVVPRGNYNGTQTFTLNPPVNAREVMVVFHSAQGSPTGIAKVIELEVYGEKPVETIPPDVAITSPTAGSTLRQTVIIQANATDNTGVERVEFYRNSSLLCTDTSSPYSCSYDTTSDSDGAKTLTATAYDIFGNAGFSNPVDVIVDNTPPDTSITQRPPSISSSSTAVFEFTGTDNLTPSANLTFACNMDGSGWLACTSPKTYTGLSDGTHTFQVQASDSAGNTDPAPASYNWTVDTIPPDTFITDGPPEGSLTNSREATFVFTSSEAGATFQCQLDAGSWITCFSPYGYLSLGDGLHTFRVRATDQAGNVDSTPDVRNWRVDATPPTITITSGPGEGAFIHTSTVDFAFTSDESPTIFECNFDSAGWANCSSPAAYSNLSEGAHRFEVRGTDSAGNTSSPVQRNFTTDYTPPTLAFTSSPPEGGLVNSSSAHFEFTADEIAAFFCQLDAEPEAPCTSPYDRAGIADGNHTFQVRGVDRAGNSSTLSRSWGVDTQAPDTLIDSGPPSLTNQNSATFTFHAEGTTYQCKLDAGSWEACTSPKEYPGPLSDGSHHFEVRATDEAGNTDPTPAVYDWTIDTTAPETVLLERPPAFTPSPIAHFTFTSDDPSATFLCKLDNEDWALCNSPFDRQVAPGSHLFSVQAKDSAGNLDLSPEFYSWNVITGSVMVAPGSNSPKSGKVVNPSTPVPILQLKLTSSGVEGSKITGITLTASGSGNDATDIASILLVDDRNANGKIDEGEPAIGSSAFSTDDGTAEFALEETLPASQDAYWLIAYTFSSAQPAATRIGRGEMATRERSPLPIIAYGLLAFALIGFSGFRRFRPAALMILLLIGFFWLSSCGGGGGAPPLPAKTYAVTLSSPASIQATGTISGAPLPVTGPFPISGATLSK